MASINQISDSRLSHKETIIAHKLIQKGGRSIREILDPNFGYRTTSELIGVLQYQLSRYAPGAKISSIQRRDPHKKGGSTNFYDPTTRKDIPIEEKYIGTYPMLGEDEIYIPIFNGAKYLVVSNIGAKKKELFHTLKSGIVGEFEKSSRLIAQLNEDQLTGAYNRQFLEAFGKEHTSQNMKKSGKKFITLGIDLDGFKEINDRLGHDVGDKALIVATEILQKVFGRGIDYVCRVSGDEFVVIIDATMWEESAIDTNITTLSGKIKEGLRSKGNTWIPREKMIENPPKIGMSIGVGFMNSEISLEKAVIDADMDMLRKKPELGGVLRIARKLKDIKDLGLIPIVLDDLKNIPGIQEFPEDDKSRVSEIIDELSQIFERNSKKKQYGKN